MKKLVKIIAILFPALLGLAGCQKDFLGKKPDQSLVIPVTLADFQALLDNSNSVMNYVPYLSEIGTDDIYTPDDGFISQFETDQNSYIWAPDLFNGTSSSDWNIPYQQVFYANIVLDGLKGYKATAADSQRYNQIKGAALFYRAFAFYHIAQEFAAPYNPATAANELGIPLRLSSDVNQLSKRATLQQTYEQVITDLTGSLALLPAQSAYKTRPVKAAADAMLARVYQTMQDYSKAENYASAALQLTGRLIDYNSLDTTAIRPLPVALPNGNPEVIFYAILINNNFLNGSASLTSADTSLYRTYDTNDLRKRVFFSYAGSNVYLFKGFYTGNDFPFAGLATDELYLIRAECFARQGNTNASLQDLNTLMGKRFKTGTFLPFAAGSADQALNLVLSERRKELVYRNLRWTDLRRLNQDPRFALTLRRKVNGQQYSLAPDDKKYTFPIPNDVITASGIQQNPR